MSDPFNLRELLDYEANRINSPAFIADDPVQFPRRFDRIEDIEITGLLCATLAWGNRRMICRDCERLLSLMENRPFDYVMDKGYADLDPGMNIHRTFFARNLIHFLNGMRRIYTHYGSIEGLASKNLIAESPLPAWSLAEVINKELSAANDGACDSRCLPLNLATTALKRLNMALRWFVRNDSIVDIGIWTVIKPSQLYIPLDVHVGNTAREFGLITRRSDDKKTVIELTAKLRQFNNDDPVIYDYALFGLGMHL